MLFKTALRRVRSIKSDDKKAIEEVCREILPSQMRGYIHSRRGGDRSQIGDRSFPWSDAM